VVDHPLPEELGHVADHGAAADELLLWWRRRRRRRRGVGRHRGDGVLASDGDRDAKLLRLGWGRGHGHGGSAWRRGAPEDLLRRGRGRERGDDGGGAAANAAAVVDAPDVRGVAVDSLARVDSLGEHEDVAAGGERGGVVHEAAAPTHHLRRQRPLFLRGRRRQRGSGGDDDEAWRAEGPAVAALRPGHGARVGSAAGRGHPPERPRRGRGPGRERARGVAGGRVVVVAGAEQDEDLPVREQHGVEVRRAVVALPHRSRGDDGRGGPVRLVLVPPDGAEGG